MLRTIYAPVKAVAMREGKWLAGFSPLSHF